MFSNMIKNPNYIRSISHTKKQKQQNFNTRNLANLIVPSFVKWNILSQFCAKGSENPDPYQILTQLRCYKNSFILSLKVVCVLFKFFHYRNTLEISIQDRWPLVKHERCCQKCVLKRMCKITKRSRIYFPGK